MEINSTKKGTFKAIILIIALTALVYVNSLMNSFVGDDCFILTNNDFVKSWRNFPTIFTRSYLYQNPYSENPILGCGELSYRPVVTISYFIDYSLWKLKAFGYHLTNLILHILNALLLYFFANLIIKNKKAALWAALLFSLHPVNTQSVNNISYREELLAFLFFISSFILFIKANHYSGKQKAYRYTASITFFFLALFSKEMAITLPLLLMLYDYYFVFQGKCKQIFVQFKSRYLGYIVCALFYLWVWLFPMSNISAMLAVYPGGSFYTNCLTMSKVIATYIRWLFIPLGIHTSFRDPSLIANSFFTPQVILSLALITICFAAAYKIRKTSKELSFAIIWFFVSLLPVSNIWPITNIMEGRYLYIPSIGLCLVIALLLLKLPKSLKLYFITTFLVLYSLLTITRNYSFRNDITFWSEITKKFPNHSYGHRVLAENFMKSELFDKAIEEFKIVTRLSPENADAHNKLGLCYLIQGDLEQAIEEHQLALELEPNLYKAYNRLGCAFSEKQQYDQAIDCFEQAINIAPDFLPAYNNLGITYAKMEKWDQARKAWDEALKIDPEYKQAQENLKSLKE